MRRSPPPIALPPPTSRSARHGTIDFMAQVFGNEIPRRHTDSPMRKAARYLVVIESGGYVMARLFIDTREQVAEFDASTEEVTLMTQGLVPVVGAGSEWDQALAGHSASERSAARVYTLDV